MKSPLTIASELVQVSTLPTSGRDGYSTLAIGGDTDAFADVVVRVDDEQDRYETEVTFRERIADIIRRSRVEGMGHASELVRARATSYRVNEERARMQSERDRAWHWCRLADELESIATMLDTVASEVSP
jgi:hypothetical protein